MRKQDLGVRLLNRTSRRQRLIEIGTNCHGKAKLILVEVEPTEGLVVESNARPSSRLRIHAPVSFQIPLVPKLTENMTAYSEVQLEVSFANRDVDMLGEGTDAVLRVGELPHRSRMARRLTPYRLLLCAAPAYLDTHAPIRSPLDLASHDCLGFAYTAPRTTGVSTGGGTGHGAGNEPPDGRQSACSSSGGTACPRSARNCDRTRHSVCSSGERSPFR